MANPRTPESGRPREQGAGPERPDLTSHHETAPAEPASFFSDDSQDADVDAAPTPGLQQGRTNTNRQAPDETDDLQGPKTVEANREKVRGSRDFNPG